MGLNAAGAGERVAGTIRPTQACASHAVRKAHERGYQDSILEILHPCFVRGSSRVIPALPMPGGETRDPRTNVGSSAGRSVAPPDLPGHTKLGWENFGRRIHQD